MREPRELVPLNPNAMTGRGTTQSFDRDRMADRIADNDRLRHGFVFEYRFDATNVYDVIFSANGEVVAIEQPRTAKDLFEGQLFTR